MTARCFAAAIRADNIINKSEQRALGQFQFAGRFIGLHKIYFNTKMMCKELVAVDARKQSFQVLRKSIYTNIHLQCKNAAPCRILYYFYKILKAIIILRVQLCSFDVSADPSRNEYGIFIEHI